MSIQIVILAAGQGKRMHSRLPKVLHLLAGKPLLGHVIETALQVAPERPPIVICGHGGEQVKEQFNGAGVKFVEQKEQAGTGHAVLQAMPYINDQDRVLILYGDVPLISPHTLNELIKQTEVMQVGMVTAYFKHPDGYGRILRDKSDNVIGIVEEKDANEKERRITEINSGIYFVPADKLKKWLPSLNPQNAQGEYYLTDIIPLALADDMSVVTVQPEHKDEIRGVNDRAQLAHLERHYQRHASRALMLRGVTILDPERIDIRGKVTAGRDVMIDVNVILEGEVEMGEGCTIGAGCLLRNAKLGSHVEVKPYSVIDDSKIGDHCIIGPFARLRPGTVLAESVHIGNFVEIKKSNIDVGSKVNHLTYVGDSEIGKRVNVGAGTITCNYDGANKHKTIIGDDVFIGSCTQLVAPVTVGEGATIGAGSTITRDAPPRQLTLTRSEQRSIEDWVRPDKRE